VSLCADSETDLTVQICCVWTEAGVIPGIGGVRGHRRGVERSRGSVSPLVALPGISVTQKTGTEQSSGTLALVLRTELIGKREEVQPRVASRAQHVCRGLLQPAAYEAVQRQGSRGRGPEAGVQRQGILQGIFPSVTCSLYLSPSRPCMERLTVLIPHFYRVLMLHCTSCTHRQMPAFSSSIFSKHPELCYEHPAPDSSLQVEWRDVLS
jgi:hypothetical protein